MRLESGTDCAIGAFVAGDVRETDAAGAQVIATSSSGETVTASRGEKVKLSRPTVLPAV